MGLASWDIPALVQTVLTGLLLFPAIALFALVFSKPGAKHDHTRKWVDFTKAALGFWSASYLLSIIGSIMSLVVRSRYQWGRPREYDAINYIYGISSLLHTGAQINFFLALFYLTHAFTQLRIGAGRDETQQFRIGKKAALGVSALVALLALASFSLGVAVTVILSNMRESGNYRDVNVMWKISNAQAYLYYSYTGILTVAAIAITICATAARRKARDGPVAKAATLLLVSASLWLITLVWTVIYILVARFGPFNVGYEYLGLIDVFFGVWPSFASLLVLYLLASNDSYGLSRIHYQANDDEEQDA